MTIQLMTHDEAVNSLATERYLLREMREEERTSFEQHYLGCAHCLEAVTFAGEFMDGAKPVLREMQAAETSGRARGRERRNFLGSVLAPFRRPAPAWALVAILGSVVGYQAVQQLPQGVAPELRVTLAGIAHGAGGATTLVRVQRNIVVSLAVEYPRSGEFLSYQAEVFSSSGKLEHTVAVPSEQPGNMAVLAFRAGALEPGKHSVVIIGRLSDGSEKEVVRRNFELQFTSK